jgi:hypothetical protein
MWDLIHRCVVPANFQHTALSRDILQSWPNRTNIMLSWSRMQCTLVLTTPTQGKTGPINIGRQILRQLRVLLAVREVTLPQRRALHGDTDGP